MICVEILNHSEDIEELIQVGDYINGHKVEVIWEDAGHIRFAGCDYRFNINHEQIKSIVTKEKYASMEYRVKED